MKRLLCKILFIFAFFCLSFASPALAGDAGAGKGIFTANCNACHMGGGNVVAGPSKGLAKNYLEKNGVDTLEKIVYQVTNGKNAMSAGPITINSGVTVTVGSGETLTIV